MIKSGGEHTVSYFHKLCSKIWIEKKWPEDWINSVFVPIPKKGDTLQCNNNRMIALICHISKILLKVIENRMKKNLKTEIAEEQAGFRPGTGTRNQILNLKMVIEKCREHNKKLYLCFIDYSKAFDMVDHNILWRNMSDMGFPQHIVLLLKTMYEEQKAAVRTSYGLTEWFGIGQGVRQGCILSPHLFSIYSETIMRNALEDFEGNITVGGRPITNLRYADDTVLIAGSMSELQELVERVRTHSEAAGLFLNAKRTKVMKILRNPADEDNNHMSMNGEPVENVQKFIYLRATFTNDYDDSVEIKRRIGIAKNTMVALTNIWRDRSISLKTKKRLLNSMVFSIACYGSECWVLKTSDNKKIESFELWCYQRLLRISWVKKITNEEVIRRSGCQRRLIDIINERKLTFIGHVLRSEHLSKLLLTGMVYGPRGRGRPKTRYSDSMRAICGISITEAARMAQDRERWRNRVQRATAGRIRPIH